MVESFTELLARNLGEDLEERSMTHLVLLADGAKRMRTLIDNLLLFSRVATRAQPVVELDLNEALHEAWGNLRVTASEADAELLVERLPRIEADRGQLVRLLQNVLGKALKLSPREPRTQAWARRSPGESSVHRGRRDGDPTEQRKVVFEVFRRLHHRHDYPGSGIGLSVCERIVQHHSGSSSSSTRFGVAEPPFSSGCLPREPTDICPPERPTDSAL